MALREVVVLGAGFSTPVLIRLLQRWGYMVHVVDADGRKAEGRLLPNYPGVAHAYDFLKVEDRQAIADLVRRSGLVISMLPPAMHPQVIDLALSVGTPVLTASYITPEVRRYEEAARRARVPILMECGLDPGIDHLLLHHLLEGLDLNRVEVLAIRTMAGALPHPEVVEGDGNPWKYYFTWAPHQVVRAGKRLTRYWQASRFRTVPYEEVFALPVCVPLSRWMGSSALPDLEAYPNGDVLPYWRWLDLPALRLFWRGSLRYPGFIRAWKKLIDLGLTREDRYYPEGEPITPAGLWRAAGHAPDDGNAYRDRYLRWLGFPDREEPVVSVEGSGRKTLVDALELLLRARWQMRAGASDVVYLYEDILYREGNRYFCKRVLLEMEGCYPEETAVARGVGLPLAVVARLILDGEVVLSGGVHLPLHSVIVSSVVLALRSVGWCRWYERTEEVEASAIDGWIRLQEAAPV